MENTITISSIIGILRKNLIFIAIFGILLTIIVGIAVNAPRNIKYKYSSTLLISPKIDSKLDLDSTNLRYLVYSDTLKSIDQLIKSDIIINDVLKETKITLNNIKEWYEIVDIKLLQDSGYLKISVNYDNENKAKDIAVSITDIIRSKIEKDNSVVTVLLSSPVLKDLIQDKPFKLGLIHLIAIFILSELLILSLIVSYYFLSDKIHTANDISNISKYSLLTKIKKGKELASSVFISKIIEKDDDTLSNKTFLFSSMTNDKQMIEIINNVALINQNQNKKSLVIDFDFKNPMISHELANQENSGVIKFLNDNTINPETLVIKSARGFDFIPFGRKCSSNEFLLKVDNLKLLIEKIKNNYDIVIINSTPYENKSDYAILTSLVDANLIFIKQSQISVAFAKNIFKSIELLKSKVIGVVITDVFM